VNSVDRELLETAREILLQVDITESNGIAWERQNPRWRDRARQWLDAATAAGVIGPDQTIIPVGSNSPTAQVTRWRSVTNDGTVSLEPAPENPPDPPAPDLADDGETGPDEQQL
jgi:hypothetical protein